VRGKSAFWVIKKWAPQHLDSFKSIYSLEYLDKLTSFYEESAEKQEKAYELPSDFRLIAELAETGKLYEPDHRAVFKYLLERQVAVSDMWRYKIGVSSEQGYRRRVLFPSFDKEGKAEFCLSRTINPSAKRKYENHGKKSSQIVYDEIHVDFSKPVYLFEGVFDLLASGTNGTALLGSILPRNSKLFYMLAIERPPVILCLDPDAKLKEVKIAKLLYEFGIEVKVTPTLTGLDPGSMPKKELALALEQARPFSWNDTFYHKINSLKPGSVL
jgi:hypothetical protein